VVIVDEFHHAEATTYRRLLDHLAPRVLVGMTATPSAPTGWTSSAGSTAGSRSRCGCGTRSTSGC
jgi:hypothetical protein